MFSLLDAGVQAGSRPPDAGAYALALVLSLPLAVRQRWPGSVLALAIVGVVAYGSRSYPSVNVDFFGPVLAFYTVAARKPRKTSTVAAVASAVGIAAANALNDAQGDGGSIVSIVVILAGTWLLGDSTRQRRIDAQRLAKQADELRHARLDLAEQAVVQERLRVARELHDIVAHHMTSAIVQSTLAGELTEKDPMAARRASEAAAAVARDALREMRQILGILRSAGVVVGERIPAPSVRDLAGLFASAFQAGVIVHADILGEPPRVFPPMLDLAVYRVIQESLTNVARHALGSRAYVELRYEPNQLIVTIIDDGPVAPENRPKRGAAAPGNGIIGMRERVGLLNGSFAAGHRPEGGFRVAASFPLDVPG